MDALDKKGLTEQAKHQPERVIEMKVIQEWLNQHLPAEAQSSVGLAINQVEGVRG